MITLQKDVTHLPAQSSFKLTLTATSAEAQLDARIFVYHAGAGEFDASSGVAGDLFAHIASLSNLDEFPPDVPSTSGDTTKPYYRVNSVSIVCRSEKELNDIYGRIVEDVQELVDCFRALNAGATETTNITIQ